MVHVAKVLFLLRMHDLQPKLCNGGSTSDYIGEYYRVIKGDSRSLGTSPHGESNFGLQEVMNSNETCTHLHLTLTLCP